MKIATNSNQLLQIICRWRKWRKKWLLHKKFGKGSFRKWNNIWWNEKKKNWTSCEYDTVCTDGGKAITHVMDSSNANVALSTIKTEIKHNNTALLKTKLKYIAAPGLMESMFVLLLLKIPLKSVCDLLFWCVSVCDLLFWCDVCDVCQFATFERDCLCFVGVSCRVKMDMQLVQ